MAGAGTFTGPLFIVGMPRSGTKLIRDLLNGHSRIRIPSAETNFLPQWADEWHHYGDLADRKHFSDFYRRNLRLPYFLYAREQRTVIREDVWYAACRSFDPTHVFEALLRHDIAAPPESDLVWGDKSPAYTEHIDLLARLFPGGRIIHIIRDVRDCCLSLSRTWGKSMTRGAQRWTDAVMKAHRDGELLGGRYLELRYEDLLGDPESELRRCCDFLAITFEPSMTRLEIASEDPGDANGCRDVLSGNTRKFMYALDSRSKERVEAIAASAMREFGYDVDYVGPTRRVSPGLMACYQAADSANYLLKESRRAGFIRTVRAEVGRRWRG